MELWKSVEEEEVVTVTSLVGLLTGALKLPVWIFRRRHLRESRLPRLPRPSQLRWQRSYVGLALANGLTGCKKDAACTGDATF